MKTIICDICKQMITDKSSTFVGSVDGVIHTVTVKPLCAANCDFCRECKLRIVRRAMGWIEK